MTTPEQGTEPCSFFMCQNGFFQTTAAAAMVGTTFNSLVLATEPRFCVVSCPSMALNPDSNGSGTN